MYSKNAVLSADCQVISDLASGSNQTVRLSVGVITEYALGGVLRKKLICIQMSYAFNISILFYKNYREFNQKQRKEA